MKTRGNLVCGIALGAAAVRAVLARPPAEPPEPGSPERAATERAETGAMEIVAVGQADTGNSVQHGEVVRPRGVTEAVRQAVEEMEQSAGVEVVSALVSVGTRNRRSINSSGAVTVLETGRPIGRRDVERAVRAAIPREGGAWSRPAHELLHALPQEFWVDDLDATDDPTGWTGTRIESFVHLVTCPRDSLHRVEAAVNAAGISVERLVLAPLAAGYGVLEPEERREEIALLDIGAMTTDIAVFRRGVLWHSDVMPSGGSAYTRDIAIGLRTSQPAAEKAKRRHGAALVESVPPDDHFEMPRGGRAYPELVPRRLLAEVLQRRAESDFNRIRDELRQALSTGVPGRLVLTGGGASLEGLGEVARLVFGAAVETRGPLDLSGLRDLAAHPRFGCAVGLCRYGLRERRRADARGSGVPAFDQVRRLVGSGLRLVTQRIRRAE